MALDDEDEEATTDDEGGSGSAQWSSKRKGKEPQAPRGGASLSILLAAGSSLSSSRPVRSARASRKNYKDADTDDDFEASGAGGDESDEY